MHASCINSCLVMSLVAHCTYKFIHRIKKGYDWYVQYVRINQIRTSLSSEFFTSKFSREWKKKFIVEKKWARLELKKIISKYKNVGETTEFMRRTKSRFVYIISSPSPRFSSLTRFWYIIFFRRHETEPKAKDRCKWESIFKNEKNCLANFFDEVFFSRAAKRGEKRRRIENFPFPFVFPSHFQPVYMNYRVYSESYS